LSPAPHKTGPANVVVGCLLAIPPSELSTVYL